MNCTVKILNVAGLDTVWEYVGLPVGHKHEDKKVAVAALARLVAKGDEHAKLLRQVVAWLEIRAPRYWFQQLATYYAGAEMYSGSTMRTLLREKPTLDSFVEQVSSHTYRAFRESLVPGHITEAKANLPEGYLQTRLVMCSYQMLRRVWLQRRKHKLGEWHEFIEILHELPYCEDLIFVEPYNPWRELWTEGLGELVDPGPCPSCGLFLGHKPNCTYLKAKRLLDLEKENAQ